MNVGVHHFDERVVFDDVRHSLLALALILEWYFGRPTSSTGTSAARRRRHSLRRWIPPAPRELIDSFCRLAATVVAASADVIPHARRAATILKAIGCDTGGQRRPRRGAEAHQGQAMAAILDDLGPDFVRLGDPVADQIRIGAPSPCRQRRQVFGRLSTSPTSRPGSTSPRAW